MSVRVAHVRALVRSDIDKEWLMLDILKQLEGLVSTQEAESFFRVRRAGRHPLSDWSPEYVVRVGKQEAVLTTVYNLVRVGELIRISGEAVDAILVVNKDYRSGKPMSGSGVTQNDIREFILASGGTTTVGEAYEHFRAKGCINDCWFKEKGSAEVRRHKKKKPADYTFQELVERGLARYFRDVFLELSRMYGWEYMKPDPRISRITVKGTKGTSSVLPQVKKRRRRRRDKKAEEETGGTDTSGAT